MPPPIEPPESIWLSAPGGSDESSDEEALPPKLGATKPGEIATTLSEG